MRGAFGRAFRPHARKAASILGVGPAAAVANSQRWCFGSHCDDLGEKDVVARLREENLLLRERLRSLEGQHQSAKPRVNRIVITGGPCGGKTSTLAALKERLEVAGWRVFIAPEAATLLFHNGARFHDFLKQGDLGLVSFQVQLANLQMRLENTMHEMAAASGERAVLLCDRGAMDGKAYVSPQMWSFVLNGLGESEAHLRDRRYDAVIHLVSAAHGAEKHYTLEQAEGGASSARTETIEEARDVDNRTIQAWVGHEHLYVIDNSTPFSQKIQRAMDRVFKAIGEPVPGHTLRKIRLPYSPANEIVNSAVVAGVTHKHVFRCATTYTSPTSRIRLRSDPNGRGATFSYQWFNDESQMVKEERLDARAYMSRLNEARAAGYNTVEKDLVCFHWQGEIYEVNVFEWPEKVCILEVEAESMDTPIRIPSFLAGADSDMGGREVTFDRQYDTLAIAERHCGQQP